VFAVCGAAPRFLRGDFFTDGARAFGISLILY
jgi:hypothetical protein